VLVEVEGGVELGLFREKLLEAGLVLEGTAKLRPVFGKRLFLAQGGKGFFLGLAVEIPKGVLDTGDGASIVAGLEA
jgi:hypothetical protein